MSNGTINNLPQEMKEPSEVKIVKQEGYENFIICGYIVASIQPRPYYCDRGHWIVRSNLPDIDAADGFPRYYMDETRAKLEVVSWLNWRLWKKRVS